MGQGWQSTLLGAQSIDYRGSRYALGRTTETYAIWDVTAPGAAIESFPLTPEGWRQAWTRYLSLEGPAAGAQAEAWRPSPTFTWRRGQPLALGPMRPGQILDGAFKLYRMRFGTLIAVVGLVLLPFQIVILALTLATLQEVTVPGIGTVRQPELWVNFVALPVQFLFINPFLTASVVKTAAETYLGHGPTVGSTYRAALPRVHSILWVTFLTGLAGSLFLLPGIVLAIAGALDRSVETLTGVGAILILVGVVPAVIVFLRLAFAPAVVMVEGTRGTAALRRSWRLVKGLTGKVLGTTLLAALIVIALLFVVGAIYGVIVVVSVGDSFLAGGPGPGYYAVQDAFNAAVSILTTPFITLVTVLLYFDARIRKEAFDLSLLAQQIGAAPPAGA